MTTILLAEDEESIRDLCSTILTKEGYNVISFSSGNEAIENLNGSDFDLLLTDLRMPGIDGLSLYRILKETHEDMATVVFTGHGTINTILEALKLGIEGFIMKPFTATELLSTIESAIKKNRLLRENIRLKVLLPLLEINEKLLAELDIKDMFDRTASIIAKETRAERVSFMLVQGDRMNTVFAMGIPDEYAGIKRRVGEGIAGWVANTGRSLLLNGSHNIDFIDAEMKKNNIASGISVPLKIKDNVIGVLNISRVRDTVPFNYSDLELLSIIAGQLAVSMENLRLYTALGQSYFKTVDALATAIETKDVYTRGHSARVAHYASIIAIEMGLSKQEVEDIKIAGLLHDVGKIGIAENILLKRGELSEEEYTAMKNHPNYATKILEPVGFSKTVLSAVRHHHEWFNGTGYPDGLKGRAIPIEARILCIADTIEAMTSDRPYRDMQDMNDVIQELKRGSGRQFDPDVAAEVIRLYESGHLLSVNISTHEIAPKLS